MALDDDIRVLSAVPLFEGFTREQFRLMAFGAETMTLKVGSRLYYEGAMADCAFLLVEGRVVLCRERRHRCDIIAVSRPGAILGEMALIAENERMTDAVAQTEITMLRLSRSMFHRILEEFPDVAALLRRRITLRLQSMLAQMNSVVAKLAD